MESVLLVVNDAMESPKTSSPYLVIDYTVPFKNRKYVKNVFFGPQCGMADAKP